MEDLFEDLSLGFHLPGIFQLLPVTSSAFCEMRASWRDPSVSRLDYLDDFCPDICLFFSDWVHKKAVFRYRERHKDHFAIMPAKACASIDELLNRCFEHFYNFSGFLHIKGGTDSVRPR